MTFGPSIKPKFAVTQVEMVAKKVQIMTRKCGVQLTLDQVSSNANCLAAPYLTPAQLRDPWGNLLSLRYVGNEQDSFSVTSFGGDKRLGTADDVNAEIVHGVIVLKYASYEPSFELSPYGAFFLVGICIVMIVRYLRRL